MTRQKNRILAFLFALIPGAGQMYLGFMKRGLSLILYVVAIACVTMALGMEELIVLVPSVWMYAFFDTLNLNGCDEEMFREIKDDYITFDLLPGMKNISITKSARNLWGKGMIFVGIFFLASNILSIVGQLAYSMNLERLGWFINDILNYAPRIIISAVLIFTGKYLISGNKPKGEEINFRFFVEDLSEERKDDEIIVTPSEEPEIVDADYEEETYVEEVTDEEVKEEEESDERECEA